MERSHRGRDLALLSGMVLVVLMAVLVWANWGEMRAWYLFWRDFESLGKNEQGYREYRHREAGIVFVRVPGGTFTMGSPEGEEGRDKQELQHEVTVSPFLIAKYEVTQAEWKKFMGSDPSGFKRDSLPVAHVSWPRDSIPRGTLAR